MNEYVDPFKDPKDQVGLAIDKAIFQAEVIKSVMPSAAANNILHELGIIKSLYPPSFRQFILSSLVENGKMENNDFCLQFGGDGYFHITVEYKKSEPPVNAKKKWYQF